MTYIDELQLAINRTRRWKLGDYALVENGVSIDQTILNALEESGHIPFAERAGNGLNVNFGMFHMLVKKFHIPGALMTLGNVSTGDDMRFAVTPKLFEKMIKDESGEENMGQYHLWTTLPDGSILDHVILSSLHGDNLITVNDAVPSERYLCSQAQDLPHDLQYHPLLVGLEFFVKSGTIDPEAMNYLMGEKFAKQYD